MNFRNLMILTAITAIGFGLGFVIAPMQLGSLFGMSSTPTSNFAFRLYATALIGVGLLAWLIRQSKNDDIQRPVLTALVVTDFGVFLAVLFAQLAGLMNWGPVVSRSWAHSDILVSWASCWFGSKAKTRLLRLLLPLRGAR